jgi:TP901 family phage tail tape measure protein
VAIELATAYVSIVPSARGILGGLKKELGEPLEAAGRDAGSKSSSAFGKEFTTGTVGAVKASAGAIASAAKTIAVGVAAGVGAALAAAVGLAKIGESFDKVSDSIRVTTGASGPALAALEANFANVAKTTATSFTDAGTAITGYAQRLGLAGAPLEQLAAQTLNLSRLTKTDLATNVAAIAQAYTSWGVAAADQGPKLDELFRVYQLTGASVTDLALQMSEVGPQFRAAGISYEQTAAILGLLAKNGLSSADMLPALAKAMAVAAKDGKPAAQVFKETFDAIRNAPDDTKAAGVALDVFGAKAGPKFAALIREGKLSYEQLALAITGSGDTIAAATAATEDWQEKLTILKNRALVALGPVAAQVFNGIATVIDNLTPSIEAMSAWFSENLPKAIAVVTRWVEANWPAIKEVILGVFTAVKGWVEANWPTIQSAIITVLSAVHDWVEKNWPKIQKVVVAVFDGIAKAVKGFVEQVWPKLITAMQWFLDHKEAIIGAGVAVAAVFTAWAISAAAAAISTNAAIWPVLAVAAAVGVLAAGFVYVYNNSQAFRDMVDTVVVALGKFWDFISAYVLPIIEWLAERAIALLIFQLDAIVWAIDNSVAAFQKIVDFVNAWVIPAFESIGSAVTTAANTVWYAIADVVNFATALPGRLAGVFVGMWDGIKDAFKSALNWLIEKWNAFNIPAFEISVLGATQTITPRIDFPDITPFAAGGIVPGRGPVPIVAHGGELVLNRAQQAHLFSVANGSSNGGVTIINNITGSEIDETLLSSRLAFQLGSVA